MRLKVAATVFAVASMASPIAARAQTDELPASVQPMGACATGPISYIFIDNHSIFDAQERRFEWAYALANRVHIRTRRSIIARELLFAPGDCYDPAIADESERILRSYDFLAQVDIFGVPQSDGTYHVIVDTRDEWSTQLDLRVELKSGVQFEGFRLREANLFGRGQQLGAYFINRDVTRDYGVSFATPQLMGTRWDFRTALGKTRAGTVVSQSVAYPFVGEVSRWSTRQSFTREDRFFDYVTTQTRGDRRLHVLVPVRDKSFDLAVVTRIGNRGNLSHIGATLSYQELSYPGAPRVATGSSVESLVTGSDSSLIDPALQLREPLSSIRFGAVLGQRNVWWVKRRSLDSMRGQQDVRLGAEIGLSASRAIKTLEDDDDLFGTLAAFAGVELGDFIFTGRARFEGRRDFRAAAGDTEWKDLLGDAELLAYWRSSAFSRRTLVARAASTGGWNTRTPFQIALGGDQSLRGYRNDRFPGGRRVVVTLEDRLYWGWPFRELLDVGSTVFVDAGRMWAGDVPYGDDSGWRATVGAGLRLAVPAGSRTTYRIDVAMPIKPDPDARDLRLMISFGEPLGLLRPLGDHQNLRSREDRIASELFQLRQ